MTAVIQINWRLITHNHINIVNTHIRLVNWNLITEATNQIKIARWYRRMKLIPKIWQVIEIMIIEQMRPTNNYMQQYINSDEFRLI